MLNSPGIGGKWKEIFLEIQKSQNASTLSRCWERRKAPLCNTVAAVRIPPTYEGVGRREASRKVKYRGTQVAEERIFKTGIEGPVKSRESGLTDQRVNRIVRGCWVRGD